MDNKELWLEVFEDAIKKLPKAERNKVVMFYREMIEDKIEGGKSESEVIEELGNPNDVAAKILQENGVSQKDEDLIEESEEKPIEQKPTKKGMPVWLAFILGFIGVPVCIGLFAGWISVLVSFWAVFGAMVVSAFACCIASFASIFACFAGYFGNGWAVFGAYLCGTGVTMLLAVAFWYVSKYMTKATVWICRKLFKRGETK